MDWTESLENFWEEIKSRGYYIAVIAILIMIPFLLGIDGYQKIPILGDIYAIGRNLDLFPKNIMFLRILSLALIWAIFAASWDFLSGYTGQVSFGHAIFFGISAYFSYWFGSRYSFLIDILGPIIPFDPIIAILLAALVSALLAMLIGLVALRLKGPYLALVTMILPIIASQVIGQGELEVSGGEYGLGLLEILILPAGPSPETYALEFYIFTLIVFFISIGIMMMIAFSRIGLVFKSIREDEDASESLGINLSFYKILAFSISAFFAGLAGCLYAQHPMLRVVNTDFFSSVFSFTIIIYVVLGGTGSITGGVVGAIIMTILLELILGDFLPPGFEFLFMGLVLILSLRYLPFGLTRGTKDEKRAFIFGIIFALAWSILPSSNEGFGVGFLSEYILPSIEQASTLLGQLMSIIVGAIYTFVGKLDMFGLMLGGNDVTYLGGPLSLDNIALFIVLLVMFIITLPAAIVFLVGEIVGLFVLEGIMGLSLNAAALVRAKFFIYCIAGGFYSYYIPKIFKKVRLRYWGIYPSAGRYEPD